MNIPIGIPVKYRVNDDTQYIDTFTRHLDQAAYWIIEEIIDSSGGLVWIMPYDKDNNRMRSQAWRHKLRRTDTIMPITSCPFCNRSCLSLFKESELYCENCYRLHAITDIYKDTYICKEIEAQ